MLSELEVAKLFLAMLASDVNVVSTVQGPLQIKVGNGKAADITLELARVVGLLWSLPPGEQHFYILYLCSSSVRGGT